MLSDYDNIFGNKGGKSGSFILYSTDRKFILKEITNKEIKILLGEFLKDYHCYLDDFNESVLVRILGVYSFTVDHNQSFSMILMKSIFESDNIQAVYDLKGSKLHRQTLSNGEFSNIIKLDSNEVYKDNDFIIFQKKMLIPKTCALSLINIIEKDAQFLLNHEIMDYSLLVAVKSQSEDSKFFFFSAGNNEKGFALGIIDFFQQYDRSKQIEGIAKTIINRKPRMDISSINSKDYMKRFVKFIKTIIVPYEEQVISAY